MHAMADLLGMDPARVERLRSPERLAYFDPARIWEVLEPDPAATVIDVGTGVGFVALPWARRFPRATVYGCDVLEGMVALLAEAAAQGGLANVRALVMGPATIPLASGCADVALTAQVHHELDDPVALLRECRRCLHPGGRMAIVDWKDEDNGKSPPAGRRVPAATIRTQLEAAGFTAVASHDVYPYHAFLTGEKLV